MPINYLREQKLPGGMQELLRIAAPAGVSQAAFSLMMLTERLLLTPLGKEAPAASMLAAFISFLLAVFFVGLLTYVTPLVAQYIGAKQSQNAARVVEQGWLITIVAFPVMLFVGTTFSASYFAWSGIENTQRELAQKYFDIINIGNFFVVFDVVMSGFFSGIGRTKVVMIVNIAGMLINVPISYVLINYGVGGKFKGIEGAALGTLFSLCSMSCIFITMYLRKRYRSEFGTRLKIEFNADVFAKLLRFGSPSGAEMLLTFLAFSSFVALFHSYGVNEALASTIAFNWDIVAFMPVWGISIGLMSLVGRYMGAGDLECALRSVKSGATAAFMTMAMASLAFLLLTESLVEVFLPDASSLTRDEIMPLASTMLRLISVYCFANAANLVLSGTLRAAGDTRAVMVIAVLGHLFMIAAGYCSIRVWHWQPLTTWAFFVGSLFLQTFLFSWRFAQGTWKTTRVV